MPVGTLTALLAASTAAPLVFGLSPIFLGILPLAVMAGASLLRRPQTALQVAVVVLLMPEGLVPYAVQQTAELCSLTLVLAALVRREARSPSPPVVGAPVVLMAVFLVWALLSALWSAAPAASIDALRPYLLAFALLVLTANVVRRREDLRPFMDALALSGWLLLAYAAWSVAALGYEPGSRLDVAGMNANQLGNHLLMATTGVLWRQLDPSRPAHRSRTLQTLTFLSGSVLAIALTGSRGSLLAFGILVLTFAVTHALRTWALAALAVGAALVLAVPSAFSTVQARLSDGDPDQLSRLQLWAAGLDLIADRPFGVGLGQGPVVLPDYINARVSEDHFTTRDTMPAHNAVIEVATETGIIGSALFTAALVLAAGTCLAGVRRARIGGDVELLVYGAVVLTTSVAFLTAWAKSGGESYNVTTFLLIALWVLPARLGRSPAWLPRSRHG